MDLTPFNSTWQATEKLQGKVVHYSHSRSSILVPTESLYATSH